MILTDIFAAFRTWNWAIQHDAEEFCTLFFRAMVESNPAYVSTVPTFVISPSLILRKGGAYHTQPLPARVAHHHHLPKPGM